MRPALAACALCLAGCTQLLGLEDPATDNEVSPEISSDYLVVIDMKTNGSFVDQLQFLVDVFVDDPEARLMSMSWVPLEHATREPLAGTPSRYEEIAIENDVELDFSIDPFDPIIPRQATAAGTLDIELAADLNGIFPELTEGAGATTSAFCGDVSGQITTNKEVLQDTTFAAVKVEEGAALPTDLELSCDTLLD